MKISDLLTKVPSVPWFSIAKVVVPFALAGGLVWYIYDKGYDSGESKVTAQWSAEREANKLAIAKLRGRIAQKEIQHQTESKRISNDLDQVKKESAAELARLDANYNQRLLNSAVRGVGYQRLAESGTSDSFRLASHAAELDRSLEEGRRLVGELRQGIVEKDRQLTLLGAQITSDRILLSGTNEPAASK